MKPASVQFYTQLATETTTLCRIMRITPRGRDTIYLTDHDQNITYDSNVYTADKSVECSAIENAIGGSRASFDLTVILGETISRADAERGIYDGARIEIDFIFYDHTDYGVMPCAAGEVAGVSVPHMSRALLSVMGFVTITQRILTEQYSPTCRADFCDARCTLDIEDFGTDFTVDSVMALSAFTASEVAAEATGFFDLGTVRWLTGDNEGTAVEVLHSTNTGLVTLMVRPSFTVQVGDTGRIYQGCDKTLDTCDGFGNKLNFRGEPYVPGRDFATNAPNATPPVAAGAVPDPLPGDWVPADEL